jgi:hypothetical protein
MVHITPFWDYKERKLSSFIGGAYAIFLYGEHMNFFPRQETWIFSTEKADGFFS